MLALVDSGEDDNFIVSSVVTQLGTAVERVPVAKDVNALDGKRTYYPSDCSVHSSSLEINLSQIFRY